MTMIIHMVLVIAAKKQALRDVTADPAIEAALTPEALKAAWPEALKATGGLFT